MVLVDSNEVCAAMKDLFENVRAVTEFSYRYADDKRACVFIVVP